MLCGIKKNLDSQFIKLSCVSNRIIFQISSNNLKYSIIPVYLNCNNWQTDFNNLVDYVNTSNLENIMIIGDLNARIGKYQNPSTENIPSNDALNVTRNSKDDIFNRNGKKIMDFFEDFGLFVLNGTSKGDSSGEFTFISGQGQSVIDIAAISMEWVNVYKDFKVEIENFSAHLPIEVKVQFANETTQR